MTALKEWFTVRELAGMPGLPGTVQNVLKFLQKNLVVNRPKVQGKGLEYSLKCLPAETQAHIHAKTVAEVMACLPADLQQHHPLAAQALGMAPASASTALAGAPQAATKIVAASAGAASAKGQKGSKSKAASTELAPLAHPSAFYQTNQQRAMADARQAVLRQVKRLEEQTGCTTRRAMLTFLTQAAAGRLDGDTA
ncbi:MAG: hypothetical protein I8H71_15050, partial [Xanthomonadaceae bacterium]|nr:hypothetical protein [Xanthomonadaceae bacterium]